MNALIRFFTCMDVRAARAIYISLSLFFLVVVIFAVGKFVLNIEPGQIGAWFKSTADEWYALPATIMVFTVLAFAGAPQFALISAAVFAFGPVQGALYSWIATLCSGTATFYAGRLAGADVVRRYGGQTVNRISKFVSRNGFLSSMIVRVVPSAPFIVVNMAAGVSRMGYFAFVSGLALGVIPKIVLVAFASGGLVALFSGRGLAAGFAFVMVVIIWISFMLMARRWLRETPGISTPSVQNPVSDETDRGNRLAICDNPSHKGT